MFLFYKKLLKRFRQADILFYKNQENFVERRIFSRFVLILFSFVARQPYCSYKIVLIKRVESVP